MSGPTEPNDHLERSRSFDATAAAYELGRPEYPDVILDEIARVLKPGGGLGLIWNHNDVEQTDWLDAARAMTRQ